MASSGLSIRSRWGSSRYCWHHHEEIEETLGYCWRCLAKEVDPPDPGYGSWWWRISGYEFCVCLHPDPSENFCLRCQLPLRYQGRVGLRKAA